MIYLSAYTSVYVHTSQQETSKHQPQLEEEQDILKKHQELLLIRPVVSPVSLYTHSKTLIFSFRGFSLSTNALFIGILAEELIPRNLSAWKKSFSRKAHEQGVYEKAETFEGFLGQFFGRSIFSTERGICPQKRT